MFGLNNANQIPIILDPYQFTNYNGLVIGSSGSGKSFFVKLYILRSLLNSVKTIIIDPQGEYLELVKTYHGQIIEISRNSDTIINPFDLMGRDYGEKMLSLMDLFRIMCGELTEVQKNILDRALNRIYEKKDIYSNDPESWKNKPPIMGDLYFELEEQGKTASQTEKLTYDALMNRIRIYAKGTFSFLNKQTNLNLTNDLISFNIVDMPSQVKPVMMYLILDFVHKKMQENRQRKLLVVDEAWSLLRYGDQATYLFEIIKTSRKFGMGMVIITQEANDLLFTKAGRTILANTAWKMLLRQESVVMKELAERFKLNQEEQNYILTAQKGEGLLFAHNDRIPVTIVASEEEHRIITTNPDELNEQENTPKITQADVPATLAYSKIHSLDKAYYEYEGLSQAEKRFLRQHEYHKFMFYNLDGENMAYFVKKPPANQSTSHYFLVELIAEELRKHFTNVRTANTVEPDIQFEHNNTPYALEIETDHDAQKDTNKLETKRLGLCQDFGANWWFVVTNALSKREYADFGKTMTRTEIKEWIKDLKVNKNNFA